MIRNLTALLLLLTFPLLFSEERITIHLAGIDPDRGPDMLVAVYRDRDSMERIEPFLKELYPISEGSEQMTLILENIPPGDLMIMGLQDSNGNGEMDSGLFHIPREGYFCTNNRDIPSWEKCHISYEGGEVLLNLQMLYW